MKAYTDLEQSKKLTEILPQDSADMFYKYVLPKSDKIHHIPEIGNPINSLKWYNEGYTFRGKKEPITLNEYCIPCWSLAALINVIKPYNENTYTIKGTLDGGALISFDEVTNVMYQENEIVDAVYEMILWLNEKKMI